MDNSWMITVKELMCYLNIGRDKAYALMHSSGFPAIKIGGQYYVDKEALRKWLNQNAYKTYKI